MIEVNQAWLDALGYKREEVIGRSIGDFLHPDWIDHFKVNFPRFKAVGEILGVEFEMLRKDGTTILVSFTGKIGTNSHGFFQQTHCIFNDITQRKRSEKALRKSELKFRLVTETIRDVFWMSTCGVQEMVYISPAYETIWEQPRKDLYRSPISFIEAIHPDDRDAYLGVMDTYHKKGKPYECEYRIIRKGGDERWIHERGYPVSYLSESTPLMTGVCTDITDRKLVEKRLQQAQKLEAIGTLAGGIAHDFNNILSPMLGYAELLKKDLPANSPLQNYINEILKATFRSKDLVKQILAFSRQSDQEIKPLKLQPIVKEVVKLLRASIPTTIDIEQNIDPGCGIAMADATQVHQVVMNLATNAFHAMEARGGKLTVNLKQVRLTPDQLVFPELAPGEYARLTVADTGMGMEKDVLDKMFDPYFTTKATGKGTGLGLSVVQGIVKGCNGDIRIYSKPGKGTRIHVYLPIMNQKMDDKCIDQSHPLQGGIESVLLVDDEETIIRLEQQMLERLGYRVTIRTGSVEALEAFKANPGTFDLVVTDMTMPNMTGLQLARKIRGIRPEIPVIICTGFSDQINEEKIKALGIQGYAMKPVIMREIAYTIRNVLDAPDRS